MGILQKHRLSFSDAAVLTESAAAFYQLYEGYQTALKYFGDMREASSFYRFDGEKNIQIQKVHDLAGLTHTLHRVLIGMTSDTAGLLDKETLGKTHPKIITAIGEFESAVRGFRQHVRMFTSPDLIPADTKKELEEKAQNAVDTIETLQHLDSVPIVFKLNGGTLRAEVSRPEPEHPDIPRDILPKHFDLQKHPGILMVALEHAARGGIVDRYRSPDAVQEFYERTVGVAMDTAVRREELAGMVRAALAKKPHRLTAKQIEAVVPDTLSEDHHNGIVKSTFDIPARKRNVFLKLCALTSHHLFDTVADWFTTSLQDEKAPKPASKLHPETAQEAFMLLLLITQKAQTHKTFPTSDVKANDHLEALDRAYCGGSDAASLELFGKDARVADLLKHIKPFLEPSTPEMKAYYEIEALMPTNARPGGGSRPKSRRNR